MYGNKSCIRDESCSGWWTANRNGGRPTEMVDGQQKWWTANRNGGRPTEWWTANRFGGRPPELVDSQVISISINRALVPVGKFSFVSITKGTTLHIRSLSQLLYRLPNYWKYYRHCRRDLLLLLLISLSSSWRFPTVSFYP
jgi:hypothetical protein